MMVEVPSAALLAEHFAREVAFFSIGTNDLTQYTLAAQRGNRRVAYLGDACHPAVLRLIQLVVEAARRSRIWVGVCGELAGDSEAVPILLGLGVDELSMAPASIPHIKATIRELSVREVEQTAAEAFQQASVADVWRLAQRHRRPDGAQVVR
jgi:phosphocarrier protein FPr